jgi:peptidoglycan/xylan/chitin deacetylase (PgdA/CDA1 family)
MPRLALRRAVPALLASALVSTLACATRDAQSASVLPTDSTAARTVASAGGTTAAGASVTPDAGAATRVPNELGRIPVLEYHLIGDKNALYERTKAGLRHDLEVLYARGYRPVNMVDVLDRKIDLPKGMSPVVLVFDDASPSQFRYVAKDGQLAIDPTSAVGIIENFRKTHPDWAPKAVFCTLSGAEAGRSFFGNKDIEGQKTEWRFRKIQWLAEQGYELCNHTLWHANLARYGDEMVQEQIARGQLAIDSAVPGYKVRTFALPQGAWPKNRGLAHAGSWTDKKSGRTVRYRNEAILEVAGGPTRSPFDPEFNPLSVKRVQVIGDSLVTRTLDQLDRSAQRYVADGDTKAVARLAAKPAARVATTPAARGATGTGTGTGAATGGR